MLITLVIVFAVILAAPRALAAPRVTQIDRTVTKRPTEGDER